MDKNWTDTELYERYKISAKEIAFIESIIREVKFTNV